ncbi:molecular chaperone Hsp90 [candidate division MSBL1 archaeon SCGC-AAA385M11]|nr:molecular chaperone Hsp90 [candidate division MSBL1 archaeon SCGC-AAA385M11]
MVSAETYQFQAETQKLLNIIIHSIYTNKEIFLRELISNSSDALDKVRFELNRGTEVIGPDLDLEITIQVDKEKGTITLSDTGIGMTRQEIIDNLGTIAKSGTEEFMKLVAEQNENPDNIIGQFGVGFYSVFMVADKVDILTRSAQPEIAPIMWSSKGTGNFEVQELTEDRSRGTAVTIHLSEGNEEHLDPERLKSIIKRHSNFISFPIYVNGEKVNTIPALWRQPKFTVTQDQYNEFYKFLTYDSEDPLETIHIAVDAPVQFNSLVFIPPKTTAIFDTYSEEYGLDLYVHRVLIQRQNKELIPQYLGFLKGVVDTEDLPLNLSRQAIQENALVRQINSTITKQVLSRLKTMANNEPDRYYTFWKEHGKIFKLGYTDFSNRGDFSELIRFNSSYLGDAESLTSLNDYVDRMKDGQKAIYYLSGSSRENIEASPHLELLQNKGLEVLYLFEPIDEFVLQAVGSYKEYLFTAAEHVDPAEVEQFTSLEEDQGELSQDEKEELSNLSSKMKNILGDRVTEVRASKRLSNSPACLVSPDQGMSSQMQRMMRLINKDESIPKQILEINPSHPLIANLLKVYRHQSDDPFITTATEQLFETALLQAGYLSDPHTLVNRTFTILNQASQWYTQVQEL